MVQQSPLKKSKILITGFIVIIVLTFIIISYLIFLTIRALTAENYHCYIDRNSHFAVQADANFIQKIIDGEIENSTYQYSLPFDKLNREEVEKMIEYMRLHDLRIIDTADPRTSQIYLIEYASCEDMIDFFKFAPCKEYFADSDDKAESIARDSQSAEMVEKNNAETDADLSIKTEIEQNSKPIMNGSPAPNAYTDAQEPIDEPICFFSDTVTWGSGKEALVEMWLVDGAHDSSPNWPDSVAWSGDAELRVSFEGAEPVISNFYIYTSLEIDDFALYFNDYNGDGNPDFTYYNGWSDVNHAFFRIYTILADGSTALLPIAQYEQYNLSDNNFFTGCDALRDPASVPLQKEGNGYYAVYYYNGGGPDAPFGHFKHLFRWIDGQFVPSGEEIEIDRDEALSMIYPNR